jgi:hypothetical protein
VAALTVVCAAANPPKAIAHTAERIHFFIAKRF